MSFDDIVNNNLGIDIGIGIKNIKNIKDDDDNINGGGGGIGIDKKICKVDNKKECGEIQVDGVNNKKDHIVSTGTTISASAPQEGEPDKSIVNITIKSCKNITSKQALLIIPITKYFSKREILNKLIIILKGETISLRLIDWFVTNYCKKYNVMYNLNDFRPMREGEKEEQRKSFDNFIIVHNNYKGQLKAYSKRNFDPFCRRNRIRFYYEENKYFITTVGQLNFFKWALENYIINYIQNHIKDIEDDMNLRCENIKKSGTKIHTGGNTTTTDETTKKNKNLDGIISVETQIKTRKAGGTRKKRKEISQSASKSLSIHRLPTTLIFD